MEVGGLNSRQLLADRPGEERIIRGPYVLKPYPILAGIFALVGLCFTGTCGR